MLQQFKPTVVEGVGSEEEEEKKTKQPYTLLEDVQILYQVMCSQDNPYGVKLWVIISLGNCILDLKWAQQSGIIFIFRKSSKTRRFWKDPQRVSETDIASILSF